MKSLVIFASGSGTNAVNIAKVFAEGSRVKIAALLTDRENAPVCEKMENLGIPVVYFPRKEWREDPEKIAAFIKSNYHPDLVILAGFNSILKEEFVNQFEGRILNIHPSLLPAYGGPGMWGHNVHEAVLAAGEKESGVTIHIVTNEVDGGPIVLQERVPVLEGDTPETLEARIHQKEYSAYPRAIAEMLRRDLNSGDKAEPAPEAKEEIEIENIPVSPDQQWADALGIPHKPEDFEPKQPVAPVSPDFLSQPTQSQASQPTQSQAQYVGSGYQNVYQQAANQPVMPPTYMVWAILSLICCCLPAGIVAVIMAAQVSSRYYQGNYEGAKKASRNTEIWIIISFVLGVLSNTLYLPFLFLMGN